MNLWVMCVLVSYNNLSRSSHPFFCDTYLFQSLACSDTLSMCVLGVILFHFVAVPLDACRI